MIHNCKVILEFEVKVDDERLEDQKTVLDFMNNIKKEIIILSKVSMTSIDTDDNRVLQYNMDITEDMSKFVEKV